MATPPGQLNPYKLGIELFRDIEDRWNKGQFGKEWDECDDLRRATRLGQAARPRAARRSSRCASIYNDVTFIDEFLTPEFAIEQKLFVFGFNDKRNALRDRRPRVPEGEGEAPAAAHQLRPAVHRRRGRATSRTAASCCSRTSTTARTSKATTPARRCKNLQSLWRRPTEPDHPVRGQGPAPPLRRAEPLREEGRPVRSAPAAGLPGAGRRASEDGGREFPVQKLGTGL